jgi:predicted transcriptional regulator
MTGPQVHQALGPAGEDLAYKTVLTVLSRLHAKGALERHRVGRAHAYAPREGEADHAAAQMGAVLSRGGDHVAVLQRFVSNLVPDDEAALRALLTERG